MGNHLLDKILRVLSKKNRVEADFIFRQMGAASYFTPLPERQSGRGQGQVQRPVRQCLRVSKCIAGCAFEVFSESVHT